MHSGLVGGKFMPLHRGHQLLIETALAECDDVTIVVYDTLDDPRMPVEKRVGWLADLYPQAKQIVAVPDVGDYARQLEFLGPFDKVFTSEPSYAEFAEELGAEHRLVDEARELVPISGTRIRSDLYEHRGWLDPHVYASLIQKVVMVGTESTGKTTLARELARVYDTRWVHEYGRELWVAQGGGTFADHILMAQRQLQREAAAAHHARDFLFCDTNAWTTLHWSLFAYGYADERLRRLADETMRDYLWVLCDNDIPWEQDGTRELLGDKARRMHEQQVADLDRRLGPDGYLRVSGTLEERVATVVAALGQRLTLDMSA